MNEISAPGAAATFVVEAKDSSSGARAGILHTPRGPVETPVFMPVATQASVKALDSDDLRRLGSRAMLANSYHLYLRPGVDVVRAAGGLHKFMDYDAFFITDSGGFQVLSLSDLREIDDEGVTFRSHLDGSKHRLTPERSVEIQHLLTAVIMTAPATIMLAKILEPETGHPVTAGKVEVELENTSVNIIDAAAQGAAMSAP